MRRGYSIVETLAATLVMGVSISGMIGAWSYCFNRSGGTRDLGLATQIARG